MSQQNQAHEDDCNSGLDFCTFCNGNGNELMNELKWKVANLEAKNQLFEATNKHLEEKVKLLEEKQIQEKKYSELETKMRNLELMQKMEHLEAECIKKLAILEEQQKSNSEANNKLETTVKGIQKKMEDFAAKKIITVDEQPAWGWEPCLGMRGGRGRGGLRGRFVDLDRVRVQAIQKELEESAKKKMAKDDELFGVVGGPSFGMRQGFRGGFGGRGGFGYPVMANDELFAGGLNFAGRGGRGRGGFRGGFFGSFDRLDTTNKGIQPEMANDDEQPGGSRGSIQLGDFDWGCVREGLGDPVVY